MPHQRRDVAAGIFHVYTHCVWAAERLYRDDVDRLEFLRHLAIASSRRGWTCIAYCLMGSHYHLIVEVEDGVLPLAMQRMNLAYAHHHNRRYGLRGHVQFRRYGSRRIEGEDDLLNAFAYVVNNPVAAGLCAKPAEWPWSSYAGTVGLVERPTFIDPSRVLSCFDWPRIDPPSGLRATVEDS